ncbi:hypothetical protein ES708_11907 [subsurface metagenome]
MGSRNDASSPDRVMAYMTSDTRSRVKLIANHDRRTMSATFTEIAIEACRSRGLAVGRPSMDQVLDAEMRRAD